MDDKKYEYLKNLSEDELNNEMTKAEEYLNKYVQLSDEEKKKNWNLASDTMSKLRYIRNEKSKKKL